MALLLLATALVANPFEALFDTSIKDFFSVTEAVHHGFRCDASGKTPIVGTRYHLTGRKRDLCESEWLKLSEEEKAKYDAIKAPIPGSSVETVRDPRPDGARVSDHAGIVGLVSEQEITQEIHGIERQVRGSSVLVVTVDEINTRRYTPKSFATALFNNWKIGSAERNNGVLLLVVKSSRRLEIEVGNGLMWHMNSEWCTRMLERSVVPKFKRGDYGEGLTIAVQRIGARMRDDSAALWEKRQAYFYLSEHEEGSNPQPRPS